MTELQEQSTEAASEPVAEVTRADLEEQVKSEPGKEWTTEALLLATIVNNSGGFMRITQKQLGRVHGLAINVDPRTKDVLIYANGDRKRRK